MIPDETANIVKDAIIQLTAELIPSEGLEMQVDNASAMQSLVNDSHLARYNIDIRLARKKNKNGNPVAEKAVQEFKHEKLKFNPSGGAISDLDRALITAGLNRRIRNTKMSARELLTTRDQNTGTKLLVDDGKLASEQLSKQEANHPSSAKSKVPGGYPAAEVVPWPGALVTIKKDKNKNRARERYLVVKIDDIGSQCWIKKFENQLRQETYLVKNTEIELCPNQLKPPVTNSSSTYRPTSVAEHSQESVSANAPAKSGWDSVDHSSSDDDEAVAPTEDTNDDQTEADVYDEYVDNENLLNDEVEGSLEGEENGATVDPPVYEAPASGDAVQTFSSELNDWMDGTILNTSKKSLKRYPNFYNIRYSDGFEGSVKLDEDTLWRFSDENRRDYFWWRWGHLYRVEGGKSPEGTRDEG